MAKLKNARFITSVADASGYAGFGMPEIAIVGRSNVGKSSLINMLAGTKKLAKTSSTPGRTRLVNLFEFEISGENTAKKFVLVDLPGYGFAKAGHSEQNRWKDMIETYFLRASHLKGVLLLVDSRIEPTINDLIMFDYLFKNNIGTTIIATKTDKLSKAETERQKVKIAAKFKVGKENIFVSSSEKGVGKDQIAERIWQLVGGEV